MRRRDLLAAVASGTAALTAGCGYAYGGGDVRDEAHVGYTGFDRDAFHDVLDDRLVHATSGRHVVWEDGESRSTDATGVSVWTLDGDLLWSHTHDEPARGVAAGADVYLLTGSDDLVAVAATEVDSRTADGDEYETGVRWRAALEDPRPPLAADGRGAYVARDGGLQAVREGSVAWDVDLPGAPASLVAVEGGVVASTSGAVVGVAADGDETWRVETEDVAAIAAGGGRTAVGDVGEISVVRSTDGRSLWTVETAGAGRLAVTDDTVYVTPYGRVRAFDAASGDERWTTERSVAFDGPLVPAPEGVYGTRADCEAVAVGRDGERWSRELDVGLGCAAVDGWLHGETVAFLFESGEARWLQRTDQPAPGSV